MTTRALDVGRDAAHRVVRGRLDRHGLGDRLDALVDAREVGDVGQLLVDDLLAQVGQVEVDVVLAVDAATCADLLIDRAGDHVARREILQCRRVALHEALALLVAQDAALAARRLGEQDAEPDDAGRVELVELHVLERHAAAIGDRDAVAGQREAFEVILNMRPKPPVANITALAWKDVELASRRSR